MIIPITTIQIDYILVTIKYIKSWFQKQNGVMIHLPESIIVVGDVTVVVLLGVVEG
jgi:hypothetical protein